MTKIIFVEHNGSRHVVEAQDGNSAMLTALDHAMPSIIGDCGGCCSCATCHAYVDDAWIDRLPPKSDDEAMMLDGSTVTKPNSRLTCQIRVTPELDGLILHLPESQF